MRAGLPFVLVLSLVGSAAWSGSAKTAEKPTLAVVPFRVEALALNDAQRLNALLAARAATRGGYDVQADTQTTQLLEASQSLGLDCNIASIECGVKIGKIVDVQFLLIGSAIGGLDGQIGVDARVIDVKQGIELRHASALVPSDADTQSDALNAFADALFGSAPLSSLTVTVDPAGAEIVVDGAVRGVSPLAAPVSSLAPGDHYVVVGKKGFLSYRSRQSVPSAPGKTNDTMSITLSIDPEAMRTSATAGEVATPLVVAGIGALVAVGGAVTSFIGYAPYGQFQDGTTRVNNVGAANKQTLTSDDITNITEGHKQAELGAQEWNDWGRTTFVAGLVGVGIGVVAAAGGAIFGAVVVNEQGDASASPGPTGKASGAAAPAR